MGDEAEGRGLMNPRAASSIARDFALRGLLLMPALAVAAAIFAGRGGALSAAFGAGLIVANFVVSGMIFDHAAAISPQALMGAALGGYIVRLGALTGILWLVHRMSWVHMGAMSFAVIASLIVLLPWEAKTVSVRLAESSE